MQPISIPSQNSRYCYLYILLQYISSFLIIFGAIIDVIGVPDGFRWISVINSFPFFIFFLGTNILIFIKKSPKISFELFMILEICAAAFIQYAAGLITFTFKFPNYSEIAEIAISGCNMVVLFNNQAKKKSITITFDENSKILMVIGIAFLLLRIFMINPGYFLLDDQVLFGIAQDFASNKYSLLPVSPFTYNGKSVEMPWEMAFSFSLGIILKLGFPASTAFSIIFVKLYLTIQTTFVIFPVYAFLSRIIKERTALFIILLIVVFNQVLFIESPYLLPETSLMMFFTTAFYFFICVLERDGNTNENVIFCTIASSLAIATKYNGLWLFIMQITILILVYFISKIKTFSKKANKQGNPVIKWINKIDLPEFSSIFRIILFQFILLLIFYGTIQIRYFIDNGVTITDYFLRVPPYGYFGPGSALQYTPVDSFTFAWLYQHISYSFPWFVLHFTQLVGFIHVFTDDNNLRMLLNDPLSIILVVIFGISMVYMWYKTARTNVLSAFFQVSVFLLIFATILTWGEVYFFSEYRWGYPFLIMIIPPVYGGIKAFLAKIKRSFHQNFKEERVIPLLLLPILAIMMYGTICFLIVIFSGNPYLLLAYGDWQFAGGIPQNFSSNIINILENMTQSMGLLIEVNVVLLTGIIIGITGIFIHRMKPS